MLRLQNAPKISVQQNLGILDVGVASSGDVTVISVAGELDVSNQAHLRECLWEVMNAGGNCVILDIEHLTYMDSTGLSLLVVAHKRMKAAGGSFSVLAPTHIVKRLFDVAAGVPFRVVHGAAV